MSLFSWNKIMELGITRFIVSMKYTGLLKSQRQPSFSSGQDLCRVQCGTWEKRECSMQFPCLNFRAISSETSCLAATLKTKTKRVATKTFFNFFRLFSHFFAVFRVFLVFLLFLLFRLFLCRYQFLYATRVHGLAKARLLQWFRSHLGPRPDQT